MKNQTSFPRLNLSIQSMQRLLFSLVILASAITITHKTFGLLLLLLALMIDGWNPPSLPSTLTSTPFEYPATYNYYDDRTSTNINESVSSHEHQHQQQHRRLQQLPEDLKIDDLVEVYDPRIDQDHAFFGVICGVKTSIDGSIKYDVVSGPNRGSLYEDIDEIRVRPHQPSDYKRHAMCYHQQEGEEKGSIPCLILSYSNDYRQYYYVMTIIDGLLRHGPMQITRIRPIVYESPVFHEEFDTLSSSDPIVHTRSNECCSVKIELTGVAEIYDESTDYAAPLVITEYDDDGEISLQDTFSQTKYPGIDTKTIQPYYVYQYGTPALCKVGSGSTRNMNMIPCTIVSHSLTITGSVSYTVSYTHEGTVMQTDLSFMNVQRFLKSNLLSDDRVGVVKRREM